MNRFLPHPILAAVIFVAWLAIAERVTPGQIVLATIAALGGAWMMATLRLERALPRRALLMFRLGRDVIADIVRSNFAVARLVLGRSTARHSEFLMIPLTMQNRTGLALLACIITATPGTIWVSYDRETGSLLLHILDLIDEQEWHDTIRNRYERQLMEIFE